MFLYGIAILMVRASAVAQMSAVDYYNRGGVKLAKGDFEGAIADYNRVIELNPKLANAYTNRGQAKANKGDLDGAIADYNRAIELKPEADVYNCRSNAKRAKGDLDGAIADLDRTIELSPRAEYGYNNRGLTKQLQGDLHGALADFTHSFELGNYSDYPRFYSWIIRSRLSGKDSADKELQDYMSKRWNSAPNDWPSRIGDFLLGKITEADFFTAAKSSDSNKERGQLCEAWYFAGMKQLLAGNKAIAKEDLEKCRGTQMTSYSEFAFAGGELKRLGE